MAMKQWKVQYFNPAISMSQKQETLVGATSKGQVYDIIKKMYPGSTVSHVEQA